MQAGYLINRNAAVLAGRNKVEAQEQCRDGFVFIDKQVMGDEEYKRMLEESDSIVMHALQTGNVALLKEALEHYDGYYPNPYIDDAMHVFAVTDECEQNEQWLTDRTACLDVLVQWYRKHNLQMCSELSTIALGAIAELLISKNDNVRTLVTHVFATLCANVQTKRAD